MLCSFRLQAAKLKAQTDPWSYGGTILFNVSLLEFFI